MISARPPAPAPPSSSVTDTAASAHLDELFRELRLIRELIEGRLKAWLTVEEIAEQVGRDPYTVRTWIKRGKLPAVRVTGSGPRGRLLVRREDLDRLLSGGRADPVPSVE